MGSFLKRNFKELLPIIFLVLSLLPLFWPALTGQTFIASGMHGSDLMLFNYPLKAWYHELLLAGQLPFWTNLLGNGFPIMAEGQIGIFYPFHLALFYFLPTLLAFNLNIFLHFVMAAIFTYLLARQTLKLGHLGSILASLVYTLSGFLILHIQQLNIDLVIAYLPLNFLLVEKIYQEKRWLWAFLLSLVFGLQILAGNIELFYYCLLFSGLFFLGLVFTSSERQVKRAAILFLFAGVLSLGLTMVQILPTLEFLKHSTRKGGVSFETSASSSWPLETLAIFINPRPFNIYQPDLPLISGKPPLPNIFNVYGYVGLLPLALAFLAILTHFRQKEVFILTIITLFAFIFSLGKVTQVFALFWEVIPGMKFFRYPVKALFLIEFGLALLSGFGLEHLLSFIRRKKPQILTLSFWVGTAIILLSLADLYFNNVSRQPTIEAKSWFETSETVSFLKEEQKKGYFRIRSFSLNDFDEKDATDYKLQKEIQNLVYVDFNLIYEVPSSQALFAAFLEPQSLLDFQSLPAMVEGKLTLPEKMKKALLLQQVKYFLSPFPVEDQDFVLKKSVPFLRPVNHYTFFVSPDGTRRTEKIPAEAIYLYENQKTLPQFFLVPKARFIEEKEKILDYILSPEFNPDEEVVLEEPIDFGSKILSKADGEMVKYEEQEVDLKVEQDGDGFLVLGDTYYPGWKAYLDNQPVKIYQANLAFRAISVPAGKHKVRFIFEPTYFKIGLSISLLSLLVVGSGMIIAIKTNK